jgi:hypothetical protein
MTGKARGAGEALYLLLGYVTTLPTLLIAEQVTHSADLIAVLKVFCIGAKPLLTSQAAASTADFWDFRARFGCK